MPLEELLPCGEQLLIRRDPPELRCGELVVPDTASLGVTTSGIVVKVGPRALGFAEGERVIFGILAGRPLALEGVSSKEEYRLLPASDVQCKILLMAGEIVPREVFDKRGQEVFEGGEYLVVLSTPKPWS